jgi:hypothetical protein
MQLRVSVGKLHACLELWPRVILPAFVAARRRAGLAGRPPRPSSSASPARAGWHPTACVGGPPGRGRGGPSRRAVVSARRPGSRDLQDRGRRQHGSTAWRAQRARFLPADDTFITTLADLGGYLEEMALSGEAVCVDGLATRVQRPSGWGNQKVLYDASGMPTPPRAWRSPPSTVTCCGATRAGRAAAMSRSCWHCQGLMGCWTPRGWPPSSTGASGAACAGGAVDRPPGQCLGAAPLAPLGPHMNDYHGHPH